MAIDEPRPTTWLAYKPVATPMRAGPMEDVLDVAHMSLTGAAICDTAARHELRGFGRILIYVNADLLQKYIYTDENIQTPLLTLWNHLCAKRSAPRSIVFLFASLPSQ